MDHLPFNIFVMYALLFMKVYYDKRIVKSLTYMYFKKKNTSGPIIDPCGTPTFCMNYFRMI